MLFGDWTLDTGQLPKVTGRVVLFGAWPGLVAPAGRGYGCGRAPAGRCGAPAAADPAGTLPVGAFT